MNERKYEIMEAHLKGELTVMDLIDRIVELEDKENLNVVKHAYEPKEFVFDSRADALEVLKTLSDYADQYESVSVAHYYDILGVGSMYVDTKYGWSFGTIRMGAFIAPYNRAKYADPYYKHSHRDGRYIIKFPPVEVI